MSSNVLCVCTGNYVRSHIAAALVQREANRRGNTISVKAAGTTNWGRGRAATPQVRGILREILGHDPVDAFSPHKVTVEEVAWADVILAMSNSHRAFFHSHHPAHIHKVILVPELVGDDYSLPNPKHTDESSVQQVYLALERCIAAGWPNLLARLGEGKR